MSDDLFLGKFERTSAEKYDEFLSALGVNFLLRKAATASTPIMEVTKEGDVYTIKTSTVLKSMELKFKLGEEFEETTPDGRDVTAIVTQDGNKFISVQTAKKEGAKSTKVVRDFSADKCVLTSEVVGDNLVSVQEFKRL